MSKTRTRATHVRYVSPFGSPSSHMERSEAERHLREDDRRWLDLQAEGLLSAEQMAVGPPYIEELPR